MTLEHISNIWTQFDLSQYMKTNKSAILVTENCVFINKLICLCPYKHMVFYLFLHSYSHFFRSKPVTKNVCDFLTTQWWLNFCTKLRVLLNFFFIILNKFHGRNQFSFKHSWFSNPYRKMKILSCSLKLLIFPFWLEK